MYVFGGHKKGTMANNVAAASTDALTLAMVIGPLVTAAVVGGLVSLVVALINRAALLSSNRAKLDADREALQQRIDADLQIAVDKLSAERERLVSDKAWADYELRRDAYTQMAERIDCIFAGGDPKGVPELHRIARRLRLVGSDEVVRTLNALFEAMKARQPTDVLEQAYRRFFNAMRRDIRQLHTMPPEGTDLDESAFPIES